MDWGGILATWHVSKSFAKQAFKKEMESLLFLQGGFIG